MNSYRNVFRRVTLSAQLGALCTSALVACGGGGSGGQIPPAAVGFTDTALVSNNNTVVANAKTIDVNLQNPWGLAVGPSMPFWISDNNNNVSTLYSGIGANETQTVTGSSNVGVSIPPSAAGEKANPTGQVYNG